tara:strand:+ start:7801 stop:8070 length:270 start_codon:yes stop_codon:yes gene_type:complete
MNKKIYESTVSDLGYEGINSGLMVGVSSSNINSVGYDYDARTLFVAFIAGTIYQYTSVPPVVVVELLSAGSHGSFFHQNIRMSYPFSKL